MDTSPSLLYASLSDTELLTKLIGVRQTQKCYRGSLGALFTSIGTEQIPERCMLARELVRRWLDEELRRDCVLNSPETVRDCLRLHFAGREHESFVAMFLDAQHRLIATHELFRGTLTQTSVYPREVVKESLRVNAAAVIFSHNHPSGVTEPSQAELRMHDLRHSFAIYMIIVIFHYISCKNASDILRFRPLSAIRISLLRHC